MALISNERLVKTCRSGRSRGREDRLWRARKSEKVGFKARKKLIVRERKCSKRMGRSRITDWWSSVCQEQRFLNL